MLRAANTSYHPIQWYNGTTREIWFHSHRCEWKPLPEKVIYTRGISWYHTSWNILVHPSLLVYVIYFLPFLWHAYVQSTKSWKPICLAHLQVWRLGRSHRPAVPHMWVVPVATGSMFIVQTIDLVLGHIIWRKAMRPSWSVFFNPHMFVHSTYKFCKNCGIVHVEDVVDCDKLP